MSKTLYSVLDVPKYNIFETPHGPSQKDLKDIRRQATESDKRIGFACSSFDLLHTGHALMLKDSANQCDLLVIGLQTDPTLNRPDTKNKPVQSLEEREEMLRAIRYVDIIIHYATEDDLKNILIHLQPDVRILGTDWKDKEFTGYELPIKIHWHKRDHPWSTTHLRQRVHEAEILRRRE